MNETLDIMSRHGAVREFASNEDLDPAIVDAILEAASRAPSWMNGQPTTILLFDTLDQREELSQVLSENGGSAKNAEIISSCSLFLLFCIDFRRYADSAEQFHLENQIEPLVITTLDAGLALQNASIAAESLGLGTCDIGGVRRCSAEIIEHYELPDLIFPLVGLAVGEAVSAPTVKPRLPRELAVFHPHEYPQTMPRELLDHYTQTLASYSKNNGYAGKPWGERMRKYYQNQNFPAETVEVTRRQGLH